MLGLDFVYSDVVIDEWCAQCEYITDIGTMEVKGL